MTWDVDNSSSYSKVDAVQLQEDSLETQFVAGISADLVVSKKSGLSSEAIDTMEVNSGEEKERKSESKSENRHFRDQFWT